MYKVVNIADLNLASNFIETDKVVEIDASRTKMKVANNDYAHKSKSYLSDCIDTVDSAFNSYLNAINNVNTTYLTSDISNVYLPNGSLIDVKTFETIVSSDAFLTKDNCKKIETDCIAYINEMKNKAVSIIMAQLNKSFIAQNSAGKISYGQKSSSSGYLIKYTSGIADENEQLSNDYNFERGEFSLAQLLFGPEAAPLTKEEEASEPSDYIPFSAQDPWETYYLEPAKTFILDGDVEDMLVDELSSYMVFNIDSDTGDYKIHVPEASFDYKKNKTIPIAQFIEAFLKKQIKTSIKRVCDDYISKMTSVPSFNPIVTS